MKLAITIILLTLLTFGPVAVLTVTGATRSRRAQQMPGLDMPEGQPWPVSNVVSLDDRRQP